MRVFSWTYNAKNTRLIISYYETSLWDIEIYHVRRKREHKLDCLDSGRHEVAARRNVNRQPGAEAGKNVSQDYDSQM